MTHEYDMGGPCHSPMACTCDIHQWKYFYSTNVSDMLLEVSKSFGTEGVVRLLDAHVGAVLCTGSVTKVLYLASR